MSFTLSLEIMKNLATGKPQAENHLTSKPLIYIPSDIRMSDVETGIFTYIFFNLGLQPVENVSIAAGVLVASAIMEGASLIVAYGAVKKGAEAEGMTLKEYLWRGHDPTAVAVMMEVC
jgi:hypothetical protein